MATRNKPCIKYRAYGCGYEITDLNGAPMSKIPRTLFGKPVMRFANRLFMNDKTISFMEIPSNITEVGDQCFYNSSIKSIKAVGLKTIEDEAFMCCPNLVYFDGPVVNYAGDRAFYGCHNLASMSLNKIIYAGTEAFSCTSLESVSMRDLIQCGRGLFSGCDKLISAFIGSSSTKLIIKEYGKPKKVSFDGYAWTTIFGETDNSIGNAIIYVTGVESGDNMFYGCKSLITAEVQMPTIPRGTFIGCTSLENVYAPMTTKLMSKVFLECNNLKVYANYYDKESLKLSKRYVLPEYSSDTGLPFRIRIKIAFYKFIKRFITNRKHK